MRTYNDLREEWVHLRKIPKDKKKDIDFKKQEVLGLVIDKTMKEAKLDKSDEYNNYLLKSIKSEYKQCLDAFDKGVKCRDALNILSALLPQTLSEGDTKKAVIDILNVLDKPNFGLVMKAVKQLDNFNKMDMKLVSKLTKELL